LLFFGWVVPLQLDHSTSTNKKKTTSMFSSGTCGYRRMPCKLYNSLSISKGAWYLSSMIHRNFLLFVWVLGSSLNEYLTNLSILLKCITRKTWLWVFLWGWFNSLSTTFWRYQEKNLDFKLEEMWPNGENEKGLWLCDFILKNSIMKDNIDFLANLPLPTFVKEVKSFL